MPNNIFPCPECGSRNTMLKSSMPTDNSLKNLLYDLLDSCKMGLPNGGQKFVVCKDCGHTSVVMVG